MDRIEAARRAPFGDSPQVGERGARTHQRIISAGLEVFAEVGFDRSSVGLIADAAGCSRASFYQYFASKDDLFLKMTSLVAADQTTIVDRMQTVTPDRAGRDAVHDWLNDYIGHYLEFSPVFGAYESASQFDPDITQGAARVSRRLARHLAAKLSDVPDAWERPEIYAHMLMTIVGRTPALWQVQPAGVDRERLASSLADLVHRCVYGPVQGVNVGDYPTVDIDRDAFTPSSEPPRVDENETHAALMSAGREVFPRLGYHATRVDDVTAEAGVAHGTFYRYFDSKDELFAVLAADAASRMIALLGSFPSDGDLRELHGWFNRWFETHADHSALITVWLHAVDASPDMSDLGARFAVETGATIAGLLAGRSDGDLVVDTIALLGLIERAPINVQTLGVVERSDAVAAMADIVRRGFLSEPSD